MNTALSCQTYLIITNPGMVKFESHICNANSKGYHLGRQFKGVQGTVLH